MVRARDSAKNASGSVHVIVGARPNYMKVKVLLALLPEATLVHTGQHFSPKMAAGFLQKLGIRQPDVVIAPSRRSQVGMMTGVMSALEEYWSTAAPELVIVVGDVNSSAAAALVASRMRFPVAHVEAGLRSRDLSMPEEVNRILTDACSQYLFCSEQSGVDNLAAEGRSTDVYHVGNTMIDCLVAMLPQIEASPILSDLGLDQAGYAVCTFHRPSNVDDPAKLAALLERLDRSGYAFIYPVHPRVVVKDRYENIKTIPPLFYTDFVKLVKESLFVITDSGGIQEETTFLNVPCLTYRQNTERPVTIERGTNELLLCFDDFDSALESVRGKRSNVVDTWDGRASERIVEVLGRTATLRALPPQAE